MQLDQGHQLKTKQQQVLWEDSGFAEYFLFFLLVLMIKRIVFKFLFPKSIIIQERSFQINPTALMSHLFL